ncbi:hypothetical protein VCV18_008524 [Metarhizium anisopliae]
MALRYDGGPDPSGTDVDAGVSLWTRHAWKLSKQLLEVAFLSSVDGVQQRPSKSLGLGATMSL